MNNPKIKSAAAVVLGLLAVVCVSGCGEDSSTICEPCVREDLAWESQNPKLFGSMNFTDVFGVGGHIFVYGDLGRIAHHDGAEWELMEVPTSWSLTCMWGTAPDNLYATNYNYQIFHYDGTGWSLVVVPSAWYIYPSAIWGSSEDDVWAGGYGMNICHYDGSGWSPVALQGTFSIACIWGASASDIYAVGNGGEILHYNGAEWSRVSHGMTTQMLYAVWGSSTSDVWVVGTSGTLLHYDGSNWDNLTGDTTIGGNYVYDVQGNSAADVYFCAGNMIYHYNGSSVSLFAGYDVLYNPAEGIWVDGSELWLAGYSGSVSYYDGSEWSFIQEDCDLNLYDVWTDGPSNAWAVGARGAIYRYNGTEWAKQEGLAIPALDLYSVDGTEGNLFACGQNGTIVHYDGAVWADISDPGGTNQDLTGCYVSGNEAFFVGRGGAIVHAEGTALSLMTGVSAGDLTGVWGAGAEDVWASCYDGSILRYDGASWSEFHSESEINFQGIWGLSPSCVYAFGSSGVVMRWNGSEWMIDSAGAREDVVCVWGLSETDLYATTGWSIYHYEDGKWSDLGLYLTMPVGHTQSIFGSSEDNIFGVGAYGNIIHYGRK